MACHADQDCSPAPGQQHVVEAESHSMEASDFRCAICYELLLDPVVGSCGHDFCKRCIDSWQQASLQSGRVVHCPVCRSELAPAVQGGFGVCIRLRETVARLFPAELRQRQEEVALQLQQQQEAEQRRLLELQQHQQAYLAGSVGQPPPGSALHASFSAFAETYRQLSQQLVSLVSTTGHNDQAAAAVAAFSALAGGAGGGFAPPLPQEVQAWQRHSMLQNSLALLMHPAGAEAAAAMGAAGAGGAATAFHRRRSRAEMTYSTSSSVTSSSTSSSGAVAREAAFAAPPQTAAEDDAEQHGTSAPAASQLEQAGPYPMSQQQQEQPMDVDMPAAPALLVRAGGETEHGAGGMASQPATPTAFVAPPAIAVADAPSANVLQQQAMAALAAATTTAHIQQHESDRWAANLLMHSPLATSMTNSWAAPLSVRGEEELIAAHTALQKRLELCERVMTICGVPMDALPPASPTAAAPAAAAAAAATGWYQGAGGNGFATPQHQHQHAQQQQQGSHGHAPHQSHSHGHSHGHHQQQLQMGWHADAQPASPSFTASDSSAPLAFMNTPGNAGGSQAYPMGSNVDQLLQVQRQQVQAQLWRAHMHQQQQQGQAYAVAAAAAMQQQLQRGAWSVQGGQRDYHSAGHPAELYAGATRSGMSW